MAVNPDWLADRIDRDGPYLFHVCQDHARRRQALEQGLRPWDELGFSPYLDPNDWPAYTPRPGHSYLCAPWALDDTCTMVSRQRPHNAPILRVDLRELDPQLINPDEDCYFYGFMVAGRHAEELSTYNTGCPLPEPNDTVADVCLISAGLDLTVDELDARPYRSYGEWAEGVGLGDFAPHTHAAWERFGMLAVRGGVPARALHPVRFARDGSYEPELWPLPTVGTLAA